MNRFLRAMSGLLTAGLLSVPFTANAQDITLRLEPGVAAPLTSPQLNRFVTGGDFMAKGTVGLVPWLDFDPGVGVLVLPNSTNYAETGTAWMFGGGLRVKRPHDSSNTGTGFSAISPWVDGDLQYVRSGMLDRFGWNVGLGAAVPTSEERNLWVGPFVRYQSIFDDTRAGFNTNDAKVLVVGLSLEIGASAKKAPKKEILVQLVPVFTQISVCPDRDHDGVPDSVDRCPDVPGPADNFGCPKPVAVAEPDLKQVVYFSLDSNKLDHTALLALDNVIKKLTGKTYKVVVVEGHTSSEGPAGHNEVLSRQRAQVVVDYLVSKGVPRDHLMTKGLGSSKPADTNTTKAGKERNRRAEFVVSFVVLK